MAEARPQPFIKEKSANFAKIETTTRGAAYTG